jgi:hypothetical protein
MKLAETRLPAQIPVVAATSWQQKVCCFEGSLAVPATIARARLRDVGSDLPPAKGTLRSAKSRLHAPYQQPKRRKVRAARTQRSKPVN